MKDFLDQLIGIIADRKANPKPDSYTNELLSDLVRAAQKVGEEGSEVVVAALAQSDQRLVEETADLVYHTLVLLAARDVTWQEVMEELERRHAPPLQTG